VLINGFYGAHTSPATVFLFEVCMSELAPLPKTALARRSWRTRFGGRCIAIAIGTLALGAVLAAQATPAMADDKGKKKKEKTYNFEDDVIETQYLRPDTAVTDGLKNNKRASLIRIRTNFFAELIRSAEDL
jgi:hypothetical protein